jgi:ribonucleoside-diphosphate reductase alpha chain
VEPDDLRHDSMGVDDAVMDDQELMTEPVEAAMGLASNGYVRSNLYVLSGNGGGGSSMASMGASAGVSSSASGSTQQVSAGVDLGAAGAITVSASVQEKVDVKLDRIREARIKGYEGDACGECGNFTLVRNGTCMKCETCGGTSGCS